MLVLVWTIVEVDTMTDSSKKTNLPLGGALLQEWVGKVGFSTYVVVFGLTTDCPEWAKMWTGVPVGSVSYFQLLTTPSLLMRAVNTGKISSVW